MEGLISFSFTHPPKDEKQNQENNESSAVRSGLGVVCMRNTVMLVARQKHIITTDSSKASVKECAREHGAIVTYSVLFLCLATRTVTLPALPRKCFAVGCACRNYVARIDREIMFLQEITLFRDLAR